VRTVLSTLVMLAVVAPLVAQTVPRESVALDAPAPRLPDGVPDLSGIWQGGGPIADIAQGLPPGGLGIRSTLSRSLTSCCRRQRPPASAVR
jgi:hypothetical protein